MHFEGWRVTAAAGVVFAASVVSFTFPLLLTPLTTEFGWSRTAVSAAFGTSRVSAALGAPFVGALVDRFDVRWVSASCLAVMACAFASLALLTPHLWHLYAVYVVLGLATAGTSTVVYVRMIANWFDRYRGRAIGVVASSSAVGALVHPPSTDALIPAVGWRSACVILGAMIFWIGIPCTLRFVRSRSTVDVAAAVSSLTSGVSLATALRSRAFLILLAVLFGSTLSLSGAVVHLSALLTDRGVPSGRAALAVSALGAASLAGRLATGWLLDRFSPERILILLLVLATLGTFLLAGADTAPRGMVAAALLGFGTGGEADALPYL